MKIFRKILPHLVAVAVFFAVTLIYFNPMLSGKTLRAHDTLQSKGSSKEIVDFRNETGEEALWTNSQFGGMPAYQISTLYPGNGAKLLIRHLGLGVPVPASYILFCFLGFYVALLCFGVGPWLSMAGALVTGLSTYFFIITGAGHNTKLHALAYMAPMVGAVFLAYRRNRWAGASIFCVTLAMQLSANHVQITYYTMLILLIFVICEAWGAVRDRQIMPFVKTSLLLAVATLPAVGMNAGNLMMTSEYLPESTRGRSELTSDAEDKTSGLDKSYILDDYSYGKMETFDLLIPNFMGGASTGSLSRNSGTYDALVKNYGLSKREAEEMVSQLPSYWGPQRMTAGPVYIGAAIIFFFVAGLFLVKGRTKWWLLAATVLSLMLAWGNHLRFFSMMFIDWFPMYSKFRTVSMILVIAECTIPLLGILALQQFFSDACPKEEKMRALKKSLAIVGGIILFFIVAAGGLFDFSSDYDHAMGLPDALVAQLQDDRLALLRRDAWRSLAFVVLAAGLVWVCLKDKLSTRTATLLLCVLFVADLWPVNKRFLNDSDFVQQRNRDVITPTAADQAILKDTDPDFRVLNLTVSTFNDATTSYFHKSVGGYHGAKMRRYQEMITQYIAPEINAMQRVLSSGKATMADVDSLFATLKVLNMLNTRYVIIDRERPLSNPYAMQAAWTVGAARTVASADEEIAAIAAADLHREAIVDRRFADQLEGISAAEDSTASITLRSYRPNRLVYDYSAAQPRIAVFSEIYYQPGWNAYLDGAPHPHFRTNYILRGMSLPAGRHEIEFLFEPQTYRKAGRIAGASSLAALLLILGTLYFNCSKKKNS